MGGHSQAQDFENSGTSGQEAFGKGFDTNQGYLGQGFDNTGTIGMRSHQQAHNATDGTARHGVIPLMH